MAYELVLSNILWQALRRYSRRTACVCGTQRFTYEQFGERVCRLANALTAVGLSQGDRLVVLMLNCHRFVEAYFATALTGILIVPLNLRWGIKEFTHALRDCGPLGFLVDAVVAQHLAPYWDLFKISGVKYFICASGGPAPAGMLSYEELLGRAPSDIPHVHLNERDVYGLFYTSGTTGEPKGAMLTHKNLFTNAYHAQTALEFSTDSVYLHAAPMFHLADGAATWTVTWNGGTHAFVPKFDAHHVLETIRGDGVTTTVLVPTMINMLLQQFDASKHDLKSLSQILYGASPMPPELLKRAMRVLGCEFQQGYGMTEAAPLVSVLNAEDHRRALNPDAAHLLISAGKPLVGVEVRIVDAEDQDVSQGEIGEALVRGPNIMKGYWNRAAESEAALGGGWYRTKDMARLDEAGYLYIVDRKDDMIITGGENVYSTEVEAVLYSHPSVSEAAAVGVPDPVWGQAICAVVTRKPGQNVTAHELIVYCKAHLSPYKVPKRVVFERELPKSGTGKILKSEIRARYQRQQQI